MVTGILNCQIIFFRSNSDELNQTIQSLERQKESSDIKNIQLEGNLGEHKKVLIQFLLFERNRVSAKSGKYQGILF